MSADEQAGEEQGSTYWPGLKAREGVGSPKRWEPIDKADWPMGEGTEQGRGEAGAAEAWWASTWSGQPARRWAEPVRGQLTVEGGAEGWGDPTEERSTLGRPGPWTHKGWARPAPEAAARTTTSSV